MRIMAIDYGDARTGVAISDPTGLLAGYTTVIHSRKPEIVAAELARLEGGIAAIPLVSGVALPTAFANDVDGRLAFAQQVYALARPGDVVWGISTSGNSTNVNQALRTARLLSCRTLGLTGRDGGEMAGLLDVELRAPSSRTPQVQELHLPMYHALCACVEACLFA